MPVSVVAKGQTSTPTSMALLIAMTNALTTPLRRSRGSVGAECRMTTPILMAHPIARMSAHSMSTRSKLESVVANSLTRTVTMTVHLIATISVPASMMRSTAMVTAPLMVAISAEAWLMWIRMATVRPIASMNALTIR